VLKLPIANWGARTQTLPVLGSSDGSTFTTLVASRGATFDPASSNTATITFTATSQRFLRLNFTANTGWPAGQLAELEVYGDGGSSGGGGGTVNLALHKPITESSHTQNLVATNANDGVQSSYWESTNNAFPQTLTVDLGTAMSVNRVVLKLPIAGWGARTQTLSLLGSTNGSTFTTLVASRSATFDPASSNTAELTFTATSQRFLRLNITANTSWPAGQVSEFEVYGP
jgi:hypothetical protein